VLVVKCVGFGSLLRAGGLLHDLARVADVDLMCGSMVAPLFAEHPRLRKIYPLRWNGRGLPELIRVARRGRWDVVIDLEAGSRMSSAVVAAIRGAYTIGYAVPGRPHPWDLALPFHEDEHLDERYIRPLSALGLSRSTGHLVPMPTPEARRKADELIGGRRSFVALNPNASDLIAERRWARENWVRLGRKLLRDGAVAIIGGPADRASCDALATDVGEGAFSTAGRLGLQGTAHLLSRSRGLVSNDSGPAHLADVLGVPTIALFGPESPARYGPLGAASAAVWTEEECSPCVSLAADKVVECTREAACMRNIEVADVWRSWEASQRL